MGVGVQLALRWGRNLAAQWHCHFGGATGQLSGIWLGLWASASVGAAQSASMFACRAYWTSLESKAH